MTVTEIGGTFEISIVNVSKCLMEMETLHYISRLIWRCHHNMNGKSHYGLTLLSLRLDNVHAGVEGKVLTGCFADITTVTLGQHYRVLGPGQHSPLHLLTKR